MQCPGACLAFCRQTSPHCCFKDFPDKGRNPASELPQRGCFAELTLPAGLEDEEGGSAVAEKSELCLVGYFFPHPCCKGIYFLSVTFFFFFALTHEILTPGLPQAAVLSVVSFCILRCEACGTATLSSATSLTWLPCPWAAAAPGARSPASPRGTLQNSHFSSPNYVRIYQCWDHTSQGLKPRSLAFLASVFSTVGPGCRPLCGAGTCRLVCRPF